MKYPDNSYICNRMTSLQSRHTGFWLHLAAWSVVFGLPLFVPGGREPVMNMQEYVRFLVVPLSFMAVFYVNYLLLIDRYLFTRHVGRFLLANALNRSVNAHLLFQCRPEEQQLGIWISRQILSFLAIIITVKIKTACVCTTQ